MKICNANPSIEEKWKNAESGIIDMIAWKSISNGPSLPVHCLPKDIFEQGVAPTKCKVDLIPSYYPMETLQK